MHITCQHCSTVFDVPKYRADTAKYCSRKCLALAARIEMTSSCAVCNTSFTHIASRANKAKYCSRKCYYKAMHTKGSVIVKCAHCETVFNASPSEKRKFCSRACINKTKKESFKPKFSTVRKAMIRRNMLTNCQRCEYNAEPRILGVHHKDRDRHNNEISNLEVLCPNCHSLEHMKHTPHGFKE